MNLNELFKTDGIQKTKLNVEGILKRRYLGETSWSSKVNQK